jgi:hypothetical protein
MQQKDCAYCGKTFIKKEITSKYPSQILQAETRWQIRKYCTPQCSRNAGVKRSWKNESSRNARIKGIKAYYASDKGKQHIKKASEALTADKAPWWKDNDADYNSKHRWIQKHWSKSGVCQFCGITPKLRKNGRSGTEWANISDRYNRNDRKDWMELCSRCHKFFDKGKRKIRQS